MEENIQEINFIPVEVLESPIVYKKVSKQNFEEVYSISEIKLTPDDNGYITNSLLENFNQQEIELSNIAVINCGVGQGKTTAIHEIIKEYFEQRDKYIVIIATPFWSLVDKYFNQICEDLNLVPQNTHVFNGKSLFGKDKVLPEIAKQYDVHLMCIKTLLQNPGDDFFEQNKIKQQYLNGLLERCKVESKKVVFIFDEIHDSIANFDNNILIRFFKWREVVHKFIISSATFTESSIMVIKHLSMMTHDKIKIFECDRIKSNNRVDLNIIFNNDEYNSSNVKPLFDSLDGILIEALSKKEKVNILMYSKKLAENFAKEFKERYEDYNVKTNLSTSTSKNDYNPNLQINIGTNFITGINIDSGIYIIIFPNYFLCDGMYQSSSYGIFSNGAIAIVQAMARMRKGNGKIYLVVPSPTQLIEGDYLGLPLFKDINPFNLITELKDQFKYIPPDNQIYYLEEFFNREEKEAKEEIYFIRNKQKEPLGYGYPNYRPKLYYDKLEDRIMNEGDLFLRSRYAIFGYKLIPFVIWAAFNDQFLNCKLISITANIKPIKKFNIEKLFEQLEDYFLKAYFIDELGCSALNGYLQSISDYNAFFLLLNGLFNNNIILLDDVETNNNNYKLYNPILKIILKYKKGLEKDYNVQEYINGNIAAALAYQNNSDIENHDFISYRIRMFRLIYRAKRDFLNQIKDKQEMPSTYNEELIPLSQSIIKNFTLFHEKIYKQDVFFINRAFSLKRDKAGELSTSDIYDMLCKLFLRLDNKRTQKRVMINNESKVISYKKIIERIITPTHISQYLNLVYPDNSESIYTYLSNEVLQGIHVDYLNDMKEFEITKINEMDEDIQFVNEHNPNFFKESFADNIDTIEEE